MNWKCYEKGKTMGLDIRLMAGALPETSFLVLLRWKRLGVLLAKQISASSGMVLGMAAPHVGAYRHTMGGGITETGYVALWNSCFLQLMTAFNGNFRG